MTEVEIFIKIGIAYMERCLISPQHLDYEFILIVMESWLAMDLI